MRSMTNARKLFSIGLMAAAVLLSAHAPAQAHSLEEDEYAEIASDETSLYSMRIDDAFQGDKGERYPRVWLLLESTELAIYKTYSRQRFDCANRTVMIEFNIYHFRDGRVERRSDDEISPVLPDSNSELIMTFACSRASDFKDYD